MAKTKADRLAQQRLCKRRKYLEIKNNPDLYALEKEKQRAKYEKRKKENKQISITEKSPREQRQLRKKWKENSKRYRLRKKVQGPAFPCIVNVQAEEEKSIQNDKFTEDPIGIYTKEDIKKAERKIRYQELKKRLRLTKIIKNLKNINKNLKVTITRLKSSLNKNTINNNQTENQNQKVNSKDNLQNQRKKLINTRLSMLNLKSKKDTKFRLLRQQIIEKIVNFYNDDNNSTIAAGKKEFITKNKKRMQKRYLTAPLKVLHRKLLLETDVKVSYSFFTKYRPFWVLYPKFTNRETCLCIQHTNIELLIKALYNSSILNEKNSIEIVSHLCCEPRSTKCLLRECVLCKDKVLNYKEFSNDSNLIYFMWRKVTKNIETEKTLKKKRVLTVKDKITTQPLTAIRHLETLINPFFLHLHNIESQYRTMKNLKENLCVSEAVIHVDFSENYSLKYAEEVQSFHFGGSRQQVALHTSVIYTHDFTLGATRPTSVCSISRCVRHDAAAIWAHLIPLIQQTLEINPFITTLHFLSDSPVSQYRNKFMFYVITQIKNDFEHISRITWNYTEAGHGKGAPDGVGAVLKRTADRMVHFGQDVGDFNSFCKILKENVENIIIKIVNEDCVKEKETLIPKNLKPFRGTLGIHQVLWNVLSKKLTLRTVSCFLCDTGERCIHGKHLGFYEMPSNTNNITDKQNESETVTMLATTATERVVNNKEIKVLSDITFKNNENFLHYLCKPSTSKSTRNMLK